MNRFARLASRGWLLLLLSAGVNGAICLAQTTTPDAQTDATRGQDTNPQSNSDNNAKPGQDSSAKPGQDSNPQSNSDGSAKAGQDTPDAGVPPATYVIGAGDVLHISVWDEPQLTLTATVRPDGKISMPLLYDVDVTGTTPDGLQKILTDRLTRFVHKPRVTVTVQEIHSRMVFITGEVQRPGAYPLVSPMNVVQLVARSGGLTDFAKQKKIYVLRANKTTRVDVNYEKILRGQAAEKNIDLAPGDTVVVP
jgi:polysaccharide biosynthesis/export protein